MFGNKILEIRKSKFNKEIKVVKTLGIGIYIQAGGITQSGGIVKRIWKTALKKIQIKEVKNCLILGLGGGTVAGLIRKKYPKAKITGVEIDPVMVRLGRKYLNLDEYGVDIKIADARKFNPKNYDLIIVDTYLGDKYVDFVEHNFTKAKVVIFNRLYLKENRQEVDKFEKKLKKVFSSVEVVKPLINVVFICKK